MIIIKLSKKFYSKDGDSFKKLLQEIKTNSTIDQKDPLMKLLFNSENKDTKLSKEDLLNSKYKKWDYSSNLNYEDLNWKDNTLRMIVDKYNVKNESLGNKLNNSFQKTLTYKQENIYKNENDISFKDLYAERFTPIGSFEKMDSLAEQRIDDYFKNKDQNKSHQKMGSKLELNKNPFLDRTEFHLNNMLHKQNCNPVWVDKQKSINNTIDNFKNRLKNKYLEKLKEYMIDRGNSSNEKMGPFNINIFESIKKEFGPELDIINSEIRDYNLSLLQVSPNLSHLNKWKMNWDMISKELIEGIDINNLVGKKPTENTNKNKPDDDPIKNQKKPWYYIF